jgi:L-alanine-DL-glutamate epimerase-like enolase superfamily enzyme
LLAIQVKVRSDSWPLKKPFKTSREVDTHAKVIVCEISDADITGRGEAAGVSYNGETVESIRAEIESLSGQIADGISREALQELMPPGGARNAVDCALWDLEAKASGQTIWQLLDMKPASVITVYTVGLDTAENMRKDAAEHSDCPVIKVKGGIGDPIGQIGAIRDGAPNSAIVIDANQAWTVADLERYAADLENLGVKMIEQPMPDVADEALRGFESPLPLCADESCATTADLDRLVGLYSMVNIKLDKSGGLTEALALASKAESMGFELMVGNMLGSSLAMAPAFVIAQRCRYVDIDGPLLQTEDCDHAMHYDHGRVDVFDPALWG